LLASYASPVINFLLLIVDENQSVILSKSDTCHGKDEEEEARESKKNIENEKFINSSPNSCYQHNLP
jgi:hypothetical protein